MCLYDQGFKCFVLFSKKETSFFFKKKVSFFDPSNLHFSTIVPQKLPPIQTKASLSTSQPSRRKKFNSMCAVVTAHIAPLESYSTGSLETTTQADVDFLTHPCKGCSLADKELYSEVQRTMHS